MPDHLPYTMHLGDCLQVLKALPDYTAPPRVEAPGSEATD